MSATVFVVYLLTLHPSVAGGDSGELVVTAYRAEVAHPPGYPLYTLLARLFTLIPLGSIAWRVNLLSAACDAAAAGLLFATARRLTGSRAAAAVAAGLFAFSPLIWSYAVHAEVFALNNLFGALLLYLALIWDRTRDPRIAYAVAFCLGLGLTNHHTLVFYGLPLVAWLLLSHDRSLMMPGQLLRLAAAGAIGLLPYLYLPLAAADATTLSWGDPSTLQGFVDHLLRRDYGTFRLGGEAATSWTSFATLNALYVRSLAANTLVVGLPLAAVGMAAAVGRGGRLLASRGYGALLLESVAPEGILLTRGDLPTNATRYVQVCEGVRPDVVILDQEMMTKRWYIRRARNEHSSIDFPGQLYHPGEPGGFALADFVARNVRSRAIYLYPDAKSGDESLRESYELVPAGMVQRVVATTEIDAAVIGRVVEGDSWNALRRAEWPSPDRHGEDTWERVVLDDYREALHRRGVWLLRRAIARGSTASDLVRARDALLEAAGRYGEAPPWQVRKNLGLVFAHLAAHEPSAAARAVTEWRAYLASAPADEPDRAAIGQAVDELER